MEIVIEPMAPENATATSSLMEQVISSLDYYSDKAKSSEIAKYKPELLLEYSRQDPDSVLIAKEAGECIGFCVSRYDDGITWLSWFGVSQDNQRRGIGNLLLNTLQSRTKLKGIHKIWCDCRTTNHISKATLKQAGFVVICEVKNHWYGHDFVLLEKPLS